MELKLDLHIHSEASPDGRMPVESIIRRAKELGLDGVAICDHDELFLQEIWQSDFLVIPGAEFSTEYGHLLAYFITSSIPKAPLPRLVEEIHAQGGLAVLAHPFEHSTDETRLEPIVGLLDGIEVWNSRADRKNRRANEMALAFAQAHGLPFFAGSDAHMPEEIGHGVLTVTAASRQPFDVKSALKSGERRWQGVRSRAVCVAQSQFIKRRKSGASWKSYIKWFLFALQCCWKDIFQRG